MRILKLNRSIVLFLFGGIACHAIGSASDKFNRAPSFASIAAKPTIDADMIASFLLLPHATMPNLPLSRKDAQDIALFIVKMKK